MKRVALVLAAMLLGASVAPVASAIAADRLVVEAVTFTWGEEQIAHLQAGHSGLSVNGRVFLNDDLDLFGDLDLHSGKVILTPDLGEAHILSGWGSPEGYVTAPPGSIYLNTNGVLHIKRHGEGPTGWRRVRTN